MSAEQTKRKHTLILISAVVAAVALIAFVRCLYNDKPDWLDAYVKVLAALAAAAFFIYKAAAGYLDVYRAALAH